MASFGENLRRERELRGIDLREMADATKISIRFLQALEQDRVDILPGGIFPRAFVRQYAKYLGLDPERLVAEFVYAHGGETAPRRDPRAPVRVDQGTPRGLIIAGVVLGLLGLVGWKVRGQGGRTPPAAVTPSMTAPPATFAHDRVYLAGSHRNVDISVRDDPGEPFGDAAQLDGIRGLFADDRRCGGDHDARS